MSKDLEKELKYEIFEIDRLFSEGKLLLDLFKYKNDTDFVEKMAAGSFLHSFYNGIEKSLLLIYKQKNERIDGDLEWHKKVFKKGFEKDENGYSILRDKYKDELENYLKFRHFFRHTYGFRLNHKKLKPLADEVEGLWEEIKSDINKYIEKYENVENYTDEKKYNDSDDEDNEEDEEKKE